MSDFDYIKSNYGVPAEKGREIIFQSKYKGIITKDLGNYIGVDFYDGKPSKFAKLHPTWEVEYLESFGEINKKKRKEKNRQ